MNIEQFIYDWCVETERERGTEVCMCLWTSLEQGIGV